MKKLLNISLVFFSTCSFSVSDDLIHSIPHTFTKDKLQAAVTLYYYSDFFYNKNDTLPDNQECRKYFKKKGHILKCREYIKLIVPYRTIDRWKLEEKEKGYILFSINSSGDYKIHAYMESINALTVPTNKILNNTDYKPVIGIFKRHVANVKRYTFKNLKTGIKSQINATPDHPFYVMNKQKFIPIDRVSPADTLITDTGRKLHLLCPEKNDCGLPLDKKRLSIVYNLEVHKNHIYSVGDEHITVHNCHVPLHDMVWNSRDKKNLTKGCQLASRRLNIDSARNILTQVGLSEHIEDTAFFLLPITEMESGHPLYIGKEKLSLYSLEKIISKGRSYKYICLIHDAPKRTGFFYGVIQQLADKLNKSIIYNTHNDIDLFMQAYDDKVYQLLLKNEESPHQLLSAEHYNILHAQDAKTASTLISQNRFQIRHPRL